MFYKLSTAAGSQCGITIPKVTQVAYNFYSVLLSSDTLSHFVDGDWYHRTEKAAQEKYGTEDVEVKLLLILLFIDGTSIGQFSNYMAKPIMGTLGNFSLEEIKKDRSKFVLGMLPELELSAAQKKKKKYMLLQRLVHNACVEKFLEGLQVCMAKPLQERRLYKKPIFSIQGPTPDPKMTPSDPKKTPL